jgi:hypothetical protein
VRRSIWGVFYLLDMRVLGSTSVKGKLGNRPFYLLAPIIIFYIDKNLQIYLWRTDMKTFILFLTSILMLTTSVFCQFETVWVKTVPNTDQIRNVKFSHNSQWLLCETGGSYNIIYDVQTGDIIKDSVPVTYNSFFSLDDSHIYGINGNRVMYYNHQTGLDDIPFDTVNKPLGATYLTKDGNFILSTTENGFNIWDTKTGRLMKSKSIPRDTTVPPDPHQNKLVKQDNLDIQVNCDNSKIYVRTYYEYVKMDGKGNPVYSGKAIDRIFDFNSLDSIGVIPNALWSFWLSNNCQMIALDASNDSNIIIKIYNINTMQLISTINAGYNNPTVFKFTPDDKYLVSAVSLGNSGLFAYDVNNGKLVASKTPGGFNSLDISFDGKYISTSLGNLIFLKQFNVTGIHQEEQTNEILYPNPSTGIVTIQYQQLYSEITNIYISNLNGQIVKTILNNFQEAGSKKIDLNTQDISNGIYFVKVESAHLSLVFKLIVNK